MNELYKKLCLAPGVPGRENAVRDVITDCIREYACFSVDRSGSIIAHKHGGATGKKVMLCAPLDEPGFMVTGATDDGFLHFTPVGSPDMRSAVGSRIIFENGRVGIIGTKAVHLQSRTERSVYPDPDGLLIDIGACGGKEALAAVKPGDTAVFESEFISFGDGLVSARAAGSRAACLALIELLCSDHDCGCDFVFAARGECGFGGLKAAVYALAPETVICVGSRPALDTPFDPSPASCCLGGGPAITLADGSALYAQQLISAAQEKAKTLGIPVQTSSGRDTQAAGAVQALCGGVYALEISIPARYRGAPTETVSLNDADAAVRLLKAVAQYAGGIQKC